MTMASKFEIRKLKIKIEYQWL